MHEPPAPLVPGDAPTHAGSSTLCDALDRVLARGACIRGDIVITVAGVPLLYLDLGLLLGALSAFQEVSNVHQPTTHDPG